MSDLVEQLRERARTRAAASKPFPVETFIEWKAADALEAALTAAGYTIVCPADVEKAVEAGAAAVDPEIWAMDTPPPTRADIEAFHARRRKSVEIAKAVLTAASPHMPVPAGWVLVPEEPTREMYKAASDNFVPPADAAAAWYAMLSSRPKGATHER